MKGKGLLMLAAPEDDSDDEPTDKPASGRISAVKALGKALASEDWEAADEALALHYKLCKGESSDEGDEVY